MKIYTKTGDEGETSLFGGQRVLKESLRIETYGTVDELNSVVGIARSLKPHKEVDAILESIQNDLFVLGADLATPLTQTSGKVSRVQQSQVDTLERYIDSLEPKLQPLKVFILPGGSMVAAHLHFARTVCRRAERLTSQLSREEKIGPAPLVFLNRLSDLLFVLARYANYLDGVAETQWK